MCVNEWKQLVRGALFEEIISYGKLIFMIFAERLLEWIELKISQFLRICLLGRDSTLTPWINYISLQVPMHRVELLLPRPDSDSQQKAIEMRNYQNWDKDRLLTAVVRMISDHQAREIMVKQQAVMSGRPLPLSLIGWFARFSSHLCWSEPLLIARLCYGCSIKRH